jgi:putative exporter of polyketide antibiotics
MIHKICNQRASSYLLLLGMTFLIIGLATDITAFTWVSIIFILLALLGSGRWLKRR